MESIESYLRKREEAIEFLRKNLNDFKRYFAKDQGMIYGVRTNGDDLIASWTYSTLRGFGYDVWYSDVPAKDLKENFYVRLLKEQAYRKKVVIIKDDGLSEELKLFAQKINEMKKEGVSIPDLKIVTTNPYKWHPIEDLEKEVLNPNPV